MAAGSYLTQNHSRSQSEIQGDLHKCRARICDPEHSPTAGESGLEHVTGLKYVATPWLWSTDLIILDHGQMTRTTPYLAPPLLTSTPTGGRLSFRQVERA
ncbi:hypothetical protein TNCV_3836811 [Trichonephila clavipes]|nr:hypothetical protein TNCV_3836811 [Trichonephila clavipes]